MVTHSPIPYVRVTLRNLFPDAPERTKTIWAKKKTAGRLLVYSEHSKDGEDLNHKYLALTADVVNEEPARMSLKYAELEVVKE